jgi:hypothetical protein
MKISNQKLGFKCINPNIEHKKHEKEQGNMSTLEAKNSTIMDLKNSEIDAI